jgi:chemotaxis protein methyltransferase CheR
MKDSEYIAFLQWTLPKLEMRWPGFRKVRRQVCKRIDGRVRELGLAGLDDYRSYLQDHRGEWARLDAMCRISISRFYRDRGVFERLEGLLAGIAKESLERGEELLNCWSAGCASGEEAYTLLLIWELRLKSRFPELGLKITATDSDPNMLRRGETGCYGPGSIKDLPGELIEAGFNHLDEQLCIIDRLKREIIFLNQDIRERMPDGPFHLILCRNLIFTYYDEPLQLKLLKGIRERLIPGGILVTGIHEALPSGAKELFVPDTAQAGIYRRDLRPQGREG